MELITVIVFYSEKTAKLPLPSSSSVSLPEVNLPGLRKLEPTVTHMKLKTRCCEKFKKNKRCRRCPCFDLPNGPADRID